MIINYSFLINGFLDNISDSFFFAFFLFGWYITLCAENNHPSSEVEKFHEGWHSQKYEVTPLCDEKHVVLEYWFQFTEIGNFAGSHRLGSI